MAKLITPRKPDLSEIMLRFPDLAPLGLFLLTIAVTLYMVIASERNEQTRIQLALAVKSTEIAMAIERQTAADVAFLRAGAALFTNGPAVSHNKFKAFVSEINIDQNFRGTEGVGWAINAAPQTLSALEHKLSREIKRPVRVWPTPLAGRIISTIVAYREPQTTANAATIGYDMMSEPNRRQAMELAYLTHQATLSRMVRLHKDSGSDVQPSVILFVPVYHFARRDNDDPLDRQPTGFIFSPIHIKDFVNTAVEQLDLSSINFSVTDVTNHLNDRLFSRHDHSLNGDIVERTVKIADRQWLIKANGASRDGLSELSIIRLVLGLALATLFMFTLRTAIRRAKEEQRILAQTREQQQIREALTRELNHRVKNILANVLSITSLTRRSATSLDGFVESLIGRIRALAATHDLLVSAQWGSTDIGAIIASELSPYQDNLKQRIKVEGPPIALAPNDALSLGLTVHELSTNAAKFGSLSVDTGGVHITWVWLDQGRAAFTWREFGGPTVLVPSRRGFGSDLIERTMAREMKTNIKLEYHPDGVICHFLIPIRDQRQFQLRSKE